MVITAKKNQSVNKAIKQYELAQTFYEQGKTQKAEKAFAKTISLFRKLEQTTNNQISLARVLYTAADFFSDIDDLEYGLALYCECEALFNTLAREQPKKFLPELASTQTNMAATLIELEQFTNALDRLKQAEATQRKLVIAAPDEHLPELEITLSNTAKAYQALEQLDLAQVVYEQLLPINRQLALAAPEYFNFNLAQNLNEYSTVLIDLKAFTKALPLCEEALVLYQQCMAENEHSAPEELAAVWGNLGQILAELNQHDKADVALSESLAILVDLAKTEPDIHELAIARALNSLACLHADQRRFNDAKALFEQALAIFNKFAVIEAQPLLTELAMTLQNLATTHFDNGNYSEAQQLHQQALNYFRQKRQNTSIEYQQDILTILNSLGVQLHTNHHFEIAKETQEEALQIAKQLYQSHPQVYAPELALSQNNLASLLIDMDQFELAQHQAEAALAIYQQLATQHPSIYLPALACSHGVMAELNNRLNNYQFAEQHYIQAINIWRRLAQQSPKVYHPELADALQNYAVLLVNQWHFTTARQALSEALELYRHLAATSADEHASGLALTLLNLGKFYIEIRDFPTAMDAYQESLALHEGLAEKAPDAHLSFLALALNNYGALLIDMKDFNAAIDIFNRAILIYRSFTVQNLTRFNLAGTLQNLCHACLNLNQLPQAQAAIEEAVNIGYQLVTDQPQSYQPILAEYLNSLGVCQNQNNQLQQACYALEQATSIRRKISENNRPAPMADFAMALNNLGEFYCRQGNYPQAQEYFEQAITAAESIDKTQIPAYLAKQSVTDAYEFMLEQVIRRKDFQRAFKLCAVLRDGNKITTEVNPDAMQNTQDWLTNLTKSRGIKHQLLIINQCPNQAAVMGLIEPDNSRFGVSDASAWHQLIAAIQHNEKGGTKRRLAQSIFQSLPAPIKQALMPQPNKPVFTLISSDTRWSLFPWELLCFGPGKTDYLGLHQAFPRVGAIEADKLNTQLSLKKIGRGQGNTTILAPFDTAQKPLKGINEELKALNNAITANGGKILQSHDGADATDVAMTQLLELQPDIFYYSGHGTVLQNEEVLVLHSAQNNQQLNTAIDMPLTFFGRQNINQLAQKYSNSPYLPNSLMILNCCHTGKAREAGGQREDLVAALLNQGAACVVAYALPIRNTMGNKLGEVLFEDCTNSAKTIADAVLYARRKMALELCDDLNTRSWGSWCMLHLHGNGLAVLPFKPKH